MRNNDFVMYDIEIGEETEPNETDTEIIKTLNENIKTLNDNIQVLNENLEEASTEEASTEEASTEEASTEEASTEGIIFSDSSADTHLYLSTEVENATLNDLYSIALSTRNVLLLFLLLWLVLKLFGSLKNVICRIMNK